MTKKSLDSRLRGNDIRHFFRAVQQSPTVGTLCLLSMTVFL
ncbi:MULTISPECIES: hypothetical protein [unclassified Rickettsia]